ncbi:Uncharacterised protein [Streptococcus pneumoniae]|nr:Uncharacterised protein [Streptococcus pneumoniae]
MNVTLKLLPTERTIVQSRRQTETIINQHFFTRTVSIVHALDLPYGHMTLVNHNQEIIWEEVEKRIRRLSFAPSIHVARIIFNPIGIAHLTQHFDIILCPLFQTLGFKQFTFLFKDS